MKKLFLVIFLFSVLIFSCRKDPRPRFVGKYHVTACVYKDGTGCLPRSFILTLDSNYRFVLKINESDSVDGIWVTPNHERFVMLYSEKPPISERAPVSDPSKEPLMIKIIDPDSIFSNNQYRFLEFSKL